MSAPGNKAPLRRGDDPQAAFPLFERVDQSPPATRDECEPCATCQAYVNLVRSLVADFDPRSKLTRTKWLAANVGKTLECGHAAATAPDHARPCVRTACTMHLDTLTERAGRPHGQRAPVLVRVRQKADSGPSCARDEAEAGKHETGDIARTLDRTEQNSTRETPATMPGLRRVQQLEDRSLNKVWVATEAIAAIEAWADKELRPRGAHVEALYPGYASNENGELSRATHPDVVYVTVAIATKDFKRPVEAPKEGSER